jgi:putative serine protease PepD
MSENETYQRPVDGGQTAEPVATPSTPEPPIWAPAGPSQPPQQYPPQPAVHQPHPYQPGAQQSAIHPVSGGQPTAATHPVSGAQPTTAIHPVSGAHQAPAAPYQVGGQHHPGVGHHAAGQPWHAGYDQPAPTYGFPPQQSAPAPRGRGGRTAATGLLALLLAGGGGLAGGLVVHSFESGKQQPPAAVSGAPTSVTVIDRSSLADIAAKVKPSVVAVQTQNGEGSGVVFNTDGFIVTNNHVVADARGGAVQVNFSDGKTVSARVVGTDTKTDLAVIQVSGVSGLTAAQFGDSNALRVGDSVLAIGSPLGLEGSVTAGIVSALNRTIREGDNQQNPQSSQQTTDIAGAVQTDAAINPGNSGGALVDLNGKVIGINTAIATSGQSEGNIGVGFAIPGNLVKRVAESLITGKKVSHPFLGVRVTTANGNGGATVSSVTSGSPAAQAGLAEGDVITRAGTKDIHTGDDLVNAVQTSNVGDRLELTVKRGGVSRTLTAVIGEAS